MQKIKNKIGFKIIVFLVEIVLTINPIVVFAYDSANNIVISGNNIAIRVKVNDSDINVFEYALYNAPITNRDFFGNIISTTPANCSDTNLDSTSVITTGTSPANGFCNSIAQCNNKTVVAEIVDCGILGNCITVNACAKSVATAYNNKIIEALQAATDVKISNASLDKTRANDALASCGGDLSCINNVLAALQKDTSFSKSTNVLDSNAPLTAAGLSDLINSTSATSAANTSPINSASNDTVGLMNKMSGPTVNVSFGSSEALKPGTKMTASAVPGFFNNSSDPSKLYFTWYLKREGCDNNKNVSGDLTLKAKCDFDGDDKITENDWKIAATRVIVKGNFDSSETDYTKNTDDKIASYKAYPSPKLSDNEWIINAGENTNPESAPNCYVQAPKSGRTYEIRKTNATFNNECPSGYHRACVSDQIAKCDGINPLYNQTDADAAAAAIPPTTYAISKKITNDFNACAIFSESNNDANSQDIFCGVDSDAALKNFQATVKCKSDGKTPICVKDGNLNMEIKDNSQNLLGVLVGTSTSSADIAANNEKMCSAVAKPDASEAGFYLASPNPFLAKESCTEIVNGLVNGIKNSAGSNIVSGNLNLAPKCNFEKSDNLCKHLFPEFPKKNVTLGNGTVVDLSDQISGDGKFTQSEKQFWGTDPNKASTNGIGKDEENVVGLGVDKFTWMYSSGDQVGVVVEGDSTIPTEHTDSSYKRMWAFSKGKCEALEKIESSSSIDKNNPGQNTRGFYIDGNNGILTTEINLNDCLEDNLLDPGSENAANLKIQLNTNPANPINDPNGRGDVLNVISGAVNTQNPDGLIYNWSIQKSRDGSNAPIDTTNWQDITTGLQSGGSLTSLDLNGLGKKELAIKLNMQNSLIENGMNTGTYNGGVFYLRIKVKIISTAADGGQIAEGSAIVRTGQQQNEIRVYPVSANSSGVLSLNNSTDSLCNDASGKTACYVTKNEIIGITIPKISKSSTTPFSWTINGNAINCNAGMSTQCADGNTLFFPILGNEGEAVDIVAKGLNKDGESIEVSRHFVIVPPQVQIIAVDNNIVWPKLLGYYKDLDGNKYPDYSTQVLESTPGQTITLGAAFYPAWKAGQTGFDWSIDGQIMPQYSNQNKIQLSIDKVPGESYNIGLVALYSPGSNDQANNIRKALLRNWGISPEDVIEQSNNANVQLNIIDQAISPVASNEQKSLSANLITHLPEQLIFLLKISITSILLMLATGLLFALMPETLFKEEK